MVSGAGFAEKYLVYARSTTRAGWQEESARSSSKGRPRTEFGPQGEPDGFPRHRLRGHVFI